MPLRLLQNLNQYDFDIKHMHIFTSTPSAGVSRQEFEQLKNDLHYWQNTTLSLIKDRAGE